MHQPCIQDTDDTPSYWVYAKKHIQADTSAKTPRHMTSHDGWPRHTSGHKGPSCRHVCHGTREVQNYFGKKTLHYDAFTCVLQ